MYAQAMAAMTVKILMTVLFLKISHNAAYMLTFECQVTGGDSTVWNGSAFMCPASSNAIVLLHNRFNSGTNGTCNDTNNSVIVGESIEVNGSKYTSQLNISFSSSLIGKTVNCVRDDGLNDSVVSNYTITNNTHMNSTESDVPRPGSTSLVLEILMVIVGGCLTLILTGAVLMIIFARRMTKKKPRSKEPRTGETPGPTESSDYCPQIVEQPSSPEPIFHCAPSKTMTGSDGYSLCVLNNVNESVIVTNSNYSYLEDPEDPEDSLEILEEEQSDGINRRSGCLRIEGLIFIFMAITCFNSSLSKNESLDLDSLLVKLYGRVDTQWFALGTALGIPTEFLDSLKSYNYPDQDCMVEMLDYWLRNHPDQPTWKEIADAIEDIHDYLLAKSIKAVYDVPTSLMGIGDHNSVRV